LKRGPSNSTYHIKDAIAFGAFKFMTKPYTFADMAKAFRAIITELER